MPPTILAGDHETRYLPFDVAELRIDEAPPAEGDAGVPPAPRGFVLSGYAAVFNSLSQDLGGFRERIAQGAFRRAIETKQDVVLVPDHNYQAAGVLGRSTNGTLRLSENPTGLRVSARLPETTVARDLAAVVKRGDVAGMSFAFRVNGPDGENWSKEGDLIVREVRDVDLMDVSVVVFPAYQASSVKVDKRCLDQANQLSTAPTLAVLRLQRERLSFL